LTQRTRSYLKSRFALEAGAITLNVAEELASDPPLVLLHGGTGCWQGWVPIIPDLTPAWQIFAPDLYRHGKSGYAPGR
jgi:pimeloyl-ACP methyl ester carboxylesterase